MFASARVSLILDYFSCLILKLWFLLLLGGINSPLDMV